jgi:hypothetical protein
MPTRSSPCTSSRPVEDFHAARDRDEERERREEHGRELAHPGDEHVVPPHEEAQDREGDGAHGDREVPKMARRENVAMSSLTMAIPGTIMM